jgi:hypothetical protein
MRNAASKISIIQQNMPGIKKAASNDAAENFTDLLLS